MPTSITFFPNGEYLQGHIPLQKVKRGESAFGNYDVCTHPRLLFQYAVLKNSHDVNADFDAYLQKNPGFADMTGTEYYVRNVTRTHYVVDTRFSWGWHFGRRFEKEEIREYFRTRIARPLGLSSVEILAAPAKRKKCLRMTKPMARNIRNGCFLMEQRHGQRNLSFLTLTVPNLSSDGMDAVRRFWGQMVNKLFKYLRKKFTERTGENMEYVYCTEIQTSRLQSTGVVAPHLHAVFRGRRGRHRSWVFSYLEIRQVWADIMSQYVGESFNTEALENIQQVKKSAGAYLAKYMGKGVDSADYPELRTHWGGMSRNLCRLVRSACTRWRSDGNGSEYIHRFINAQDRLVKAALLKHYTRTWVDLEKGERVTDPRDGREYGGVGFWVGGGVLSTPTYCGGVAKVVSYLYSYVD